VQISASLVLLDAVLALAVSMVQGFQRIKELTAVGIAAKVTTVPIIIVMTLAWGIVGAVLAGVVSQLLNAGIYARAIRRIFHQEGLNVRFLRIDRAVSREILRTALPLFGAFIVMRPAALFQASFLALVVGYVQLGFFRIASSLYRIALTIPYSLTVPLLPAISEMFAVNARERTQGQLSSLLRITAFLSLPISLVIGLGSYHIINILYGGAYVAAAPLAFVISAAAFVDALGTVIENTLLGSGRTKQAFYVACLQALVIIVSSYILISLFGLLGMGFAMLTNAIVYAVVVGLYLLRRQEIRFRDFRTTLVLALAGFLVASAIVIVGRLSDPLPATVFLIGLVLVEYRLLSPRDKFLLRDAVRGILGRGK
jgi:O-antigen/teichoic acid export membrane protein